MKRYNIFLIILLVGMGSVSFSQVKSNLSFTASYNINEFKMNSLNSVVATKLLDNFSAEKIKTGQSWQVGLSYQFTKMWDFGIYGGYQFSTQASNPTYYKLNEYSLPIEECFGRQELRVEALSVGIHSTIYLSQLFQNDQTNSFFKRLHWTPEINLGIGFSKFTNDEQPPEHVLETRIYSSFTGNSIQGQLGLKVEYSFLQSSIFASLGLRGGYQYFKIDSLKDSMETEWRVEDEKVKLDFSGFYLGVYLKLSK